MAVFRIITSVVTGLFIAGGALFFAFVALGLGWVLSKVFPVSVFQGSAIIVAVSGMGVFSTAIGRLTDSLVALKDELASSFLEPDEDDWEDDDWEEGGEESSSRGATAPAAPVAQVPRNAPCPCGSGRKYKLCHGQKRSA